MNLWNSFIDLQKPSQYKSIINVLQKVLIGNQPKSPFLLVTMATVRASFYFSCYFSLQYTGCYKDMLQLHMKALIKKIALSWALALKRIRARNDYVMRTISLIWLHSLHIQVSFYEIKNGGTQPFFSVTKQNTYLPRTRKNVDTLPKQSKGGKRTYTL